MSETDWLDCWCYGLRRTVKVRGLLSEGRIAEVLDVKECNVEITCENRGSESCLIGKRREARWVT